MVTEDHVAPSVLNQDKNSAILPRTTHRRTLASHKREKSSSQKRKASEQRGQSGNRKCITVKRNPINRTTQPVNEVSKLKKMEVKHQANRNETAILISTEIIQVKSRRKSATIPTFQQFQDPIVLRWLHRKAKELRNEQIRRHAEERSKQVIRDATDFEQRKRLELAQIAYANWLVSKSKSSVSRKTTSSMPSERIEEEKTGTAEKPLRRMRGLFRPVSTPSDSILTPDMGTLDSTASTRVDDTIALTVPKNFSESRKERVVEVVQSEAPQLQLEDVITVTADALTNVTLLPKEKTPTASAPILRHSRGDSLAKRSAKPVQDTVDMMSVYSREAIETMEPVAMEQKQVEAKQAKCNEPDSIAKMTHKQWLRQKFLQKRCMEQARWEAKENVALMMSVDPELVNNWKKLLDSRLLDLRSERILTNRGTVIQPNVNLLTARTHLVQSGKVHDRHRSQDESDLAVKEQMALNRAAAHRRRLHIKFPPTLLTSSNAQSVVLNAGDKLPQQDTNSTMDKEERLPGNENLLADTVVQKSSEWAETQICMQVK